MYAGRNSIPHLRPPESRTRYRRCGGGSLRISGGGGKESSTMAQSLAMTPHTTDPSRTAVFTGTFDPLTLGHLDVIRRGRTLFEHLVVAIGVNPNKQALFTIEERVTLARQVVAPFENVSVEAFDELAVQFVRRIGA